MIRVPSRTVTGGGRRRALRLSRIIIASALVTVAYLPATTGAAKPARSIGTLDCRGVGRPAVVLDAGLGADHSEWSRIEPVVSANTRVCAWDRPRPRGAALRGVTAVTALHAALRRASVAAPYVLVGHSIAGLEVRLFRQRFPAQVAALVVTDGTPPSEVLGERGPDSYRGESLDEHDAAQALRSIPRLGALALAVVERGQDRSVAWETEQARLSSSSSDSLLVVATRSDHGIPYEQPGLVAAVVTVVVDAIRSDRNLHCSPRIVSAGGACLAPGSIPPIPVSRWPYYLAGIALLTLAILAASILRRRGHQARSAA
jgi:hypothetical protein